MCTRESRNKQGPQLDLQQLGARELESFGEGELQALGKELIQTTKKWGFAEFVNHGLPLHFVTPLHEASGKFFSLPLKEKMKFQRKMETFQGYSYSETEKLNQTHDNVLDNKETFDYLDVNAPDFPPFPEMKIAATISTDILRPFSDKLIHLIELGMGWSVGTLANMHRQYPNGLTTLRTLRYPRMDAPVGSIRGGEHKDFGTFTMEVQSKVRGLQVFHENDWINVDGDPEVISFFFGEMMEIFSGNEISAAWHRVVVTDPEIQKKEDRLALVFFYLPDKDTTLQNFSGEKTYGPVNTGHYSFEKLKTFYQ